MVEFHDVGRHRTGQRGMEIATMGQQIGRAVFVLGRRPEQHVEQDLAGLPVAVVPRARIEGVGAQPVLQSQAAQHVHGVAADLNARAKPRELPGLLVDRDGDAHLAQGRGGGESAHAGADDGDVEFAAGHVRRCHSP
jgi:hypothetical protein